MPLSDECWRQFFQRRQRTSIQLSQLRRLPFKRIGFAFQAKANRKRQVRQQFAVHANAMQLSKSMTAFAQPQEIPRLMADATRTLDDVMRLQAGPTEELRLVVGYPATGASIVVQ